MCINVGWSLQIQDTNATARSTRWEFCRRIHWLHYTVSELYGSTARRDQVVSKREESSWNTPLFRKALWQNNLHRIAVIWSTKLQSCIEGNKYKLLSISQGCMWNAFHKLRDSDVMKWVWSTFVAAIEVPQQCRTESQPRNLWWTGFLKRYWEKGQCYETPLHSQKSIGTNDHAREECS